MMYTKFGLKIVKYGQLDYSRHTYYINLTLLWLISYPAHVL